MHIYVASFSAEGLTTAAETLLQIVSPATRRVEITEIGVSFDGVTATDAPVLVDLLRQTSAGTSGGTPTLFPIDPADPAALSSALSGFSAEPTGTTDFVRRWRVTPNGGLFVFRWPESRGPRLAVSSRIGLRATAAAVVNATGYVEIQE